MKRSSIALIAVFAVASAACSNNPKGSGGATSASNASSGTGTGTGTGTTTSGSSTTASSTGTGGGCTAPHMVIDPADGKCKLDGTTTNVGVPCPTTGPNAACG